MKTFFSRHGGDLALDEQTLQELCQKRLLAIHFPWLSESEGEQSEEDTYSLDWTEYGRKGKGALRAMSELAEEGGYVCVTYGFTKTMFIGKVDKNSKVQINDQYTWTTDRGRKAVIKTLKYELVAEIPPDRQALLLACQPTHGTFCHWRAIGGKVERLAKHEREPKSLDSLLTSQQEVMCAEYLRIHKHPKLPKLRSLLLPVGRTMKDLDLLGLADDNKLIRAQVTFGNDKSKKSRLEEYDRKGEGHLIYFCNPKTLDLIQQDAEGVWIVSLQRVFDEFTDTSAGQKWLDQIHSML